MKKKIILNWRCRFNCYLLRFFLLSSTGSTYYYSQIDNSKIEQADTNGGVIDLYVCPQKWRSMLIIS